MLWREGLQNGARTAVGEEGAQEAQELGAVARQNAPRAGARARVGDEELEQLKCVRLHRTTGRCQQAPR